MKNLELSFTFRPVTKDQISNLIKHSNDKKAAQSTNIPTALIKKLCDFFSDFTYKSINQSITEGNFMADFKEAEVCPLFKNDGRAFKSNFRPIIILFNVSKIYERCLYNQLSDCFDKNLFSKYQCGFCKDALLVMMNEKVK